MPPRLLLEDVGCSLGLRLGDEWILLVPLHDGDAEGYLVKLAPPSSLSSCSFSLSLPALEALVAMTASSIAPSMEET